VQPPVQQQQQQSPVHSGGQSAQEVVGSTAGGPGAARSHQFTYDMGTVAQSGTNARPSNFVMGKARVRDAFCFAACLLCCRMRWRLRCAQS
jgi:hypothetical protein